jgi:predicted naringenin-chalcone synthase
MIARRYRILGVLLAIVAVATAASAIVLSYDSPCVAAAPLPPDAQRMRAVLQTCYGSPEVLTIDDVVKPTPGDNDVLVRVRAASVNPAD